jgi:hypothetical protein
MSGKMTQTNGMHWKDIAEILGIAAIVASLIFVGLQIQQDREIAELESYIDSASQITELNQLIAENKEIWVKGLDGEDLGKEEEAVFQSIYRTLWVRKIAQWNRSRRLTNTGNVDSIVQGFAHNVYLYPGLRRVYDEGTKNLESVRAAFGRDSGDASFLAVTSAALAHLDANPPPQTTKTYYVY